ncbi:bacterial Ig-like domain-containing protein [Furfurilactobacillus curtus]|uniref:bacterial Ig-like domain-containing protein n=1 Tax=Furfurilactobacillus curtus TaxID=1746200 RepID=UPI0038B2F0DE
MTTPILTVAPSAVYTNNGVWNPKLNVLELIDDHGNKVDLNGIQLKEVQDEFDAKIDANVVEYRVLSGSENKVGSMVVEFAWGNKADHGIGDYVTQTTTVTWLENQAQVLVKNSEIPLDSGWQVSDNVTVVKRMNGSIVDPGQITYKYVESADQFDDVIPDNVIEWTGSVNVNVPGVYTITVAWSDPVTASFTVTIKGSDGNNTGNSNSGNSNSGSNNTGNSNSGNSGSNNTGNSNSGNSNSGSNNTGNSNSDNSNSGSNNTGNSNSDNSNSNLVTNGQGKAPNFGASQMIADTVTGNFNAQTKGTKPAPNRHSGLPATEAPSNDAVVLIGLTGMLAALGLLGTKKHRHES